MTGVNSNDPIVALSNNTEKAVGIYCAMLQLLYGRKGKEDRG